MNLFLITILSVLINLFSFAGLVNLPLLVSVFLFFKFPTERIVGLIMMLLIIFDLLNLHPLGVSSLLFFILAKIFLYLYNRYLPHRAPVFLILIAFCYFSISFISSIVLSFL